VIKTRLDRKATNISVLAAIGVRRDGQKALLSIRNMGGESTAAWRQFLTGLDARGLRRPEFVIVDGAPGLGGRACGGRHSRNGCPFGKVRDRATAFHAGGKTRSRTRALNASSDQGACPTKCKRD
jgi:hypothetical protein